MGGTFIPLGVLGCYPTALTHRKIERW